jgi:prephenate dehydrogenase
VAIVGAGLIGASIGLALRTRGIDVRLWDSRAETVQLAGDLGAGRAGREDDPPADLVVAAVPPREVARVITDAARRNLGWTLSDVGSVKSRPLAEIELSGPEVSRRFCGGHPVAGSERSGPAAARADLFENRIWVVTPTARTAPEAVAAVDWLARSCGARPVRMDPVVHDEVFARLSHAPQLVASALAALLLRLPPDAVALAGPGLRDILRIAGSSPQMWAQIVAENAAPVAQALREVATALTDVADELSTDGLGGSDQGEAGGAGAVHDLVRAGNEGYARLPGKHGGARERFTALAVVVRDRPGELARLLTDAAAAQVNVEDLRVEHAPGQPLGIVELDVAPERAGAAVRALAERGWAVHQQEF